MIATILSSEFTVLTRLLARIAADTTPPRDYHRRAPARGTGIIRRALSGLSHATSLLQGPAAKIVPSSMPHSPRHAPDWFGSDIGTFRFSARCVDRDPVAPGRTGHSIARNRHFAFKVQQFTGPLMAKSLEDTAFYRYHRLLAAQRGRGRRCCQRDSPVPAFTSACSGAPAKLPHGLKRYCNTTTLSAAKMHARGCSRSLNSPTSGRSSVREWRTLNARSSPVRRRSASLPAHEYMLYQAPARRLALGGIDPDFEERMQAYAIKSAREGKEQTSWLAPDEAYESGLTQFLGRLLDRSHSARFIDTFEAFARRTALIGALKSLTQLVLKAMMPGVPDFYQGTEFWDLSLVDPDNRRPARLSSSSVSHESCGR